MTVSDNYEPVRTVGNGATSQFTFPWKIFDETEIDVSLIDTASAANKSLQTLNTDYSVTINTVTEGGTVTFLLTNPPSAKDVIRERSVDNAQNTDLPDVGTITESQLENAFDKNTIQVQQLDDKLDRIFQMPVEVDTSLTINYSMGTPVDKTAPLWVLSGSTFKMSNSTTDISNLASAVAQTTSNANLTAADVISTNADVISTTSNATLAANAANSAQNSASAAANIITDFSTAKVRWVTTSNTELIMSAAASFLGVDTSTFFTLSANKTLDTTNSGIAGGLDTGALALATPYYILGIGDTTGANSPHLLATLVSTYGAFTTANLPTGYNDFKRVGHFHTENGAANMVPVVFREGKGVHTTSLGQVSTSSATFANIDFSAQIPPVIRMIHVRAFRSAASTVEWAGVGETAGHLVSNGGAAAETNMFPVVLDINGIFLSKVTVGSVDYEIYMYYDDLIDEGQ